MSDYLSHIAKSTRSRQPAINGINRELQVIATTALRPAAGNARKHSKEQVRAIARSIEAFGFNAPILVDRGGIIIAGHGRYEAAKLLKLSHVPTIYLDHLTELQAKAYMLADNKLTDRSTWDDNLVAVQLKELSELALNFEIEATGFEPPEIDFRIQSLESPDETDKVDEFRLADGPAVTQLGDIWHLGPHRIFCGDMLNDASIHNLFGTEKASVVFTDPPYNVKIDGHVGGRGSITHREFAMAAGEMSEIEFTDFLTTALQLMRDCTVSGTLIYACMDWRHMSEMLAAGQAAEFDLVNLCVWAKSNGGMGSLYRSRHELVFVFRNGSDAHQNNVQLGRFGRNRTNVWNYPGVSGFQRKGRSKLLDLHPTCKPIALVADAILDSTKRGEIVLDGFLGSGTTLLAAERTGRRCYGIEIDPVFVDTIIDRWQRMTGHDARSSKGETFNEAKSNRGTPR